MLKEKRTRLALMMSAILGATMIASGASAATIVFAWQSSGWRTFNVGQTLGFSIDTTQLGGQVRKTVLTRVSSTTNRSKSSTNNTFHSVNNFCIDSFGTGQVEASNFVGPNSGSQVDLKCSGSRTTNMFLGWIWAEKVQ